MTKTNFLEKLRKWFRQLPFIFFHQHSLFLFFPSFFQSWYEMQTVLDYCSFVWYFFVFRWREDNSCVASTYLMLAQRAQGIQRKKTSENRQAMLRLQIIWKWWKKQQREKSTRCVACGEKKTGRKKTEGKKERKKERKRGWGKSVSCPQGKRLRSQADLRASVNKQFSSKKKWKSSIILTSPSGSHFGKAEQQCLRRQMV